MTNYEAAIAEHDRMGHEGTGCGCLDGLDSAMHGDMAKDNYEPEQPPDEPYNPVKDIVIKTIREHIPSLTDEDDAAITDRILDQIDSRSGDEGDNADLALRTCMCGVKIDGYYSYVDHLITVFGGESHLAS